MVNSKDNVYRHVGTSTCICIKIILPKVCMYMYTHQAQYSWNSCGCGKFFNRKLKVTM